MSIYSEIKEHVTTRDVAEHYGFDVNRNGMMCCPFHDDKHPSMKVDKNFYCFGCQAKGNVIEFAAMLFNIPTSEAAEKLISDLGLPIEVGNKRKKKRRRRSAYRNISRKKKDKILFERAVDRIYCAYLMYFRLLNDWLIEYEPKSPEEDFHPLWVEAVQKKDYVEYILDLLTDGSEEDKASIVIEKSKEVIKLEERIREFRSHDEERTAGGLLGASA